MRLDRLIGSRRLVAFSLLAAGAWAQAPSYDVLLTGGHVIDPRNDVDGILDVAIRSEIVYDFNGRSGVAWRDAGLDYPAR